jgi:hypothetical protein
MVTPITDAAELVDEAFTRFGASLLWNVRRPDATTRRDAASLTRLARKLAREGGADAVELASRIFDMVGMEDAGPIPKDSASGHRP